MTRSSISTFARSFLRHRMARPAGAAVMALGLGGAIAGGALALSPTVDTGLVFRGGVNITIQVDPVDNGLAYTVPAGRKFMLTDLVVANSSATSPAFAQNVFRSDFGESCAGGTSRTSELTVPVGGTLHLPFVTGIGFTAGQHVCINNGDTANLTYWTIRGYLFD